LWPFQWVTLSNIINHSIIWLILSVVARGPWSRL
jgi:hypothetical protein